MFPLAAQPEAETWLGCYSKPGRVAYYRADLRLSL
jgi:hypothetical protein